MSEDEEKLTAVKRVKPKSPWDSKKFYRLKGLDCFPEAHKLLANGYHPSKVAAMIQNQYGEYKEIAQKSLEKMLKSYYEEAIPAAEKVANQLPNKFDEVVRDFEEQVNVLQEYGNLFKLQKERIEISWTFEKETKALLKNTGREIKIAAELLDKIKKVQDEQGMAPDNMAALHQEAGMALNVQRISGISGRFLMDPSARNSVIGFLDVLAGADPRVVQAIVDIDANEETDDD